MEYLLLYTEGTDPQPYDPAEGTIAEWIADVEAREVGEYGERLRPGEDATTIRVRNAEVLVSEGPFTEAKEWVAGFDVIECQDLDEAIEVASKHPGARIGSVEIRPFMVWPDAEPDERIVPSELAGRPATGRRYVLFVCVDPTGETDGDDDVVAWVTEMDARGVRLFGDALRPPSDATHVRVRRGETIIGDGPFTESKEWIAGLDLLDVSDLDEAIEIAAAHPMARGGALVLSPLWPFDPDGDQAARAALEATELGKRSEPSLGVAG